MALRNQPYLPLYVQDFLTDEKLNCCSASSQGVYIKIMCVLHKQEEYGCLNLFKQKDKQNSSNIINFAYKLSRQITFDEETIKNALVELIEEGVLIVEGDKLFQKRMVKDNMISEARSLAGKKGGGNPVLFKQNDKQDFKQKDKQNPEYENEYENEINIEFDVFWNLYEKKVGSIEKLKKKWEKLKDSERTAIIEYIPKYKLAQPLKKFRKNPDTFFTNKSWNDELIVDEKPKKYDGNKLFDNQKPDFTPKYEKI